MRRCAAQKPPVIPGPAAGPNPESSRQIERAKK
jgi:hypothetical protein